MKLMCMNSSRTQEDTMSDKLEYYEITEKCNIVSDRDIVKIIKLEL